MFNPEGKLIGRIDLPEHTLTIGPNAKIEAGITAKNVTIFGSVTGTITAREKVDVRSSATVQGTVTCGRIAVQEGATVNGKVETKLASKSKNQAGGTKAA